jgi:hypothetical protein
MSLPEAWQLAVWVGMLSVMVAVGGAWCHRLSFSVVWFVFHAAAAAVAAHRAAIVKQIMEPTFYVREHALMPNLPREDIMEVVQEPLTMITDLGTQITDLGSQISITMQNMVPSSPGTDQRRQA